MIRWKLLTPVSIGNRIKKIPTNLQKFTNSQIWMKLFAWYLHIRLTDAIARWESTWVFLHLFLLVRWISCLILKKRVVQQEGKLLSPTSYDYEFAFSYFREKTKMKTGMYQTFFALSPVDFKFWWVLRLVDYFVSWLLQILLQTEGTSSILDHLDCCHTNGP